MLPASTICYFIALLEKELRKMFGTIEVVGLTVGRFFLNPLGTEPYGYESSQ